MKDEPWRGDPGARCLHLEGKLSAKKARIRELEAQVTRLQVAYEALPFEHNNACDIYDTAPDIHSQKPCNCGMDKLRASLQ